MAFFVKDGETQSLQVIGKTDFTWNIEDFKELIDIGKDKVHKILLGSALFKFFEIEAIQPSKARKQNKV